ncbi:MAG: hypothetical protein EDM03_15915 [Porphyrobacter sp. IPPAS B-1204]|nr:MAG: hypothetical protein EDM03_15915 [Porphyrobacter sp. IPPAS B-1204]
MNDFMLLMHNDATTEPADSEWEAYFGMLSASGAFQGGSSIGAGATFRQGGAAGPLSARLTGFIRVTAHDLTDAKRFLTGNPIYENGGTVEIRELPRD